MRAVQPPPVQADYEQLFAHIRRELEPGVVENARILVYAAEDVLAWLDVRAGGVGAVFDRGGGEPVEMIEAVGTELRALYGLLRDEADADTTEAIAYACTRIAMWAEGWGACLPALAFAQLAQAVLPSNAYFAYDVGRLARVLADYSAAESWLRWAALLSRQRHAWKVYFLSLAGLGNLCRRTGNYPLAVRFHHLSLRVARRYELRTLEGDALYDLAIMHFEMEHAILGSDYARQALQAYGPGHARVTRLAHDVALFWMDSIGDFKNAKQTFQELLGHVWEPADRVVVLANLTRAAAGAGDEQLFEATWNETWALMRRQETREGHSAALIQLAHGAASFHYWARVEIAAFESLGLARERREGKCELIAERMLEILRQTVLSDDRLVSTFPDLRWREPVEPDTVAEDLVLEMITAMRVRRDGAPESPSRTLIAGRA
jgi:tetratricopeptide (TPR) repeat protein